MEQEAAERHDITERRSSSSEPQPPPEHCSSLNLKPNSPLCWKSGCLRVPWIQCCGGGTSGGGAPGEGGVCFILIGLEGGLEAGLWLGAWPEEWRRVELFSGHASLRVTGRLTALSAPAATETAEPHLCCLDGDSSELFSLPTSMAPPVAGVVTSW